MARISEETVKKKIITILRTHPEGLTIADLAKIMELNRATVTKYVIWLVGSGLVYRRRVGAVTLHYLKEKFVRKVSEEEILKKLRRGYEEIKVKKMIWLLPMVAMFSLIFIPIVRAANGTIIYGDNTAGTLKAMTYTYPTTIGAEYSTIATSASAIQFAKIVAAPTRNEKFVAHLKADGRLDVLRCIDGCDATSDWSLIGTLVGATSTTNANKQAFDIAYEENSGRAMIVFADDPTADKTYYCIWDGSVWSPSANCGSTFTPGVENEISLGAIGVPFWIKLVSRGNEMLLGVSGTAGFAVARWNGTAWLDIVTISTAALAVTTQPAFGIAWERTSGNGLVVFDLTAADGTTYYRKFIAGTGWDTANTAGPDTGAGNNLWIELASDPSSNRISMAIADSENDASVCIWKADDVTAGFTCRLNVDAAIETTRGKDITTTWTRTTSTALFSYTDSNALTQDVICWTTAGFSGITADVGGSNTDDVDNVVIVGPAPDSEDSFILRGDIVDDLVGGRWDGAGCASGSFTRIPASGVIEGTLSVTIDNSPPIPFWFAYDIPDTTPPQWVEGTNSTNSTQAGTPVLHSLKWTDNIGLSGYIFSFDNCTGSFVNDTFASFSGTTNWSNVTKTINSTVDCMIRWCVYANDTNNNWNGTSCQNPFSYVTTSAAGYLEVELITPSPSTITNVIQNQTFTINATVYCRNGSCGSVNGTARYNLTSAYPDTPINTTFGDKPFFINETPAYAMKACPTNPLNSGDFCNLTWIVNASGDVNTDWRIGVFFNSSYPEVQANNTLNATVSIISCSVDFSLTWSSIHFGDPELIPNTYNNSAPGNDNNTYNITVNPGSCITDLYINGTDLTNSSFTTIIKVGNLTFSNVTNDTSTAVHMDYSYQVIKLNVNPGTNVTTWYWLDVPPVYAGIYNGTIFIKGVKQDETP